MMPRREEFILDVRGATRLVQKPTVTTDSQFINGEAVAKALQRAAMWLTPKVVEKYDPSDFSGLPDERQKELADSVTKFRAVADTVPPNKPATNDQFTRGLDAFRQLVTAIQETVLDEWMGAAEGMIIQVEKWCGDFSWQNRREEKKLDETLLGSYSLSQLQLFAEQHLYVLDPIARFVPGAIGAFDLSIQPSFEVTNLYRAYEGGWFVNRNGPQVGTGQSREVWSKDSFMESIKELRSLL